MSDAVTESTDALPYGFFQIDSEDRVMIWNRWMEERSDLARERMLGHRVDEVLPGLTKYQQALAEVRASGQPMLRSQLIHKFLIPIRLPKGHISGLNWMQQETHLIPFGSPERKIAVSIRDVTSIVTGREKLLALQKEWKDAKNQALKSTRLKTEFLNMMSHEIRTPLNSINLHCLLLQTDDPERMSEDQRGYVQRIQHATQDLTHQVNDLLDIAKIESGKVSVQNDEFTIAGQFEELQKLLIPSVSNPGVKLQFEDQSGTSLIRTDENKLNHILRNLITNALKFTKSGSVVVSASRSADAIVWKVADTGIGIPEQNLSDIFEEFIQLENELQRGVSGTGLGLVISRRLASLIGGTLSAESTVGVGSIFHLRIPLERLGIRTN